MNKIGNQRILITGGTGSIGSEIVRQLLVGDSSSKIVVLSRNEANQWKMMEKFQRSERLKFVLGDIRNLSIMEPIFNEYKFDLVYHAAALKHITLCEMNPTEASEINIVGTQNIVNLSLKYGVSKLVAISTDKAAWPTSTMGATKFISERLTIKTGYTCVRFGNVAGSEGSVFPTCIDNLMNHGEIHISDPRVTRFIITIPEAVGLIARATKMSLGGEIFILKMMKAFRLGDLETVMVEEIPKLLGMPTPRVVYTGLALEEKLHEDLVTRHEFPHLYESENLYMILPTRFPKILRGTYYEKMKKTEKVGTSADVPLLTREEIHRMLLGYLKERLLI